MAGLAVLLLVGVPALHARGLIGTETLNLLGQSLCYAILAISVDLLWGGAGLLSLGQALFFAAGGYVVALHLTAVAPGAARGPDWWQNFASFPMALVAVAALPGVIALIFGFPAFRSRMNGMYFAIATQALCAGLMILLRPIGILGGPSRTHPFGPLLGADLQDSVTQRTVFIATAAALLVIYGGCRWLNGTRFALVLRALRDGESRVLFSGYAAANYKLFAFVFAAFVAGIGGALCLLQAGQIGPESLAPDKSIEAVVWVVVGGRGTLIGPVCGAFGLSLLKSWVMRHCPDLWFALLGGLFVLFLLFLPEGLIGLPRRLAAVGRRIGSKPASPPPPAAPIPSS